jgi:hypothetical protein
MYPRAIIPALITAVALVFCAHAPVADTQTPIEKSQPWDAGTRYPDWQAPSTLTLNNDCDKEHSFSVTLKDVEFLTLEFKQPVPVPPHDSVTVPVKFHSNGMTPGLYNGLVTVKCLDCTEVPPCTQDHKTLTPKIRIMPRPVTSGTGDGPQPTDKAPPPVNVPPTPTTPATNVGDNPGTKEKVPPPPQLSDVKKGCCCQIDDLELRYKRAHGPEERKVDVWERDDNGEWVKGVRTLPPAYGHEFKVIITLEKKRMTSAKDRPGDCTLKWLEMTHTPPESNIRAKAKPDEWNDIGQLMNDYFESLKSNDKHPHIEDSPTFGPWYDKNKKLEREIACPLPRKTIELDDNPYVPYGRSRTLYFHIILESSCDSKQRELWAKQVLDGDPSDKATKFYVSDDGKNWVEAPRK